MSLPGKLLYQCWHRPLAALHHSHRHGGPFAQWQAARGRRAMERAAATLPAPPVRSGPEFPVHLLTGRRFIFQTVFCLHTLARHCPTPLGPTLYDDGSLDDDSRALILRLFPGTRIRDHALLRARLDQYLPAARYPVLRDRWEKYPHIRKLIDVHLGADGWSLVLDSDLLFWREPRLLLEWVRSPHQPLQATDCAENYGYSRELLTRVAGAPVPTLLNVGLCGLNSGTLDWDFLEYASATLIREAGTSYYLEQALVALLVARTAGGGIAAPYADYLTLPSPSEIAHPTAVMHHYVDTSRHGYQTVAWRHCL